jgi:hypothetical protein
MAGKKQGGTAAPPPNLTLIAGALDDAKPAPKVGKLARAAADVEEPELAMLDPRVPVEPLGKLGMIHFFLDEQKQLIGLDPQKMGKQHIRALFGRKSYLCDQIWPRYSDKTDQAGNPIITGWKPEVAADILMRACADRGIFDPQGRVRGTGAHRDDDGELVLHCGDKIFITGPAAGYVDPGLIGRYVYPAGQSRPRPDPVEQDAKVGELLLMMLKAWNWQRPLIDPMLLLGWVGCAMVGGALDWRPHAWVTGGSATGKSTLQKLLRALFDGAAITTGNATEASLRQLLKQQTLPVLFDELEASEDGRRERAVIELARVASSGDQVLRGGQNHEGAEFTVRSCFLFSSILLPHMLIQDKNRLAILELDPLEEGAKAPAIDNAELREFGRRIRRRMVDHWHRLDALIEMYKAALAAKGHGGRSADQFGTMLALADLLLYDAADEETIAHWADQLKAATLAEKSTELPDEEEILHHLATSFVTQRGGDEPAPIARMIARALDAEDGAARDRLENFGLRIVAVKWNAEGNPGAHTPTAAVAKQDLYLAIANNHVGLGRVFGETRWKQGTWAQSFSRVRVTFTDGKGEKVERRAVRRVKVRFAGAPGIWSTLIPLPAILALEPEKG